MGSFLKTLGQKFVAGFLILLPFLLAYLLIGGFVDLIVLLTTPLEDVLPHLGLMSPTARHLAVLVLLFSIFVVVGIVKDTKLAQRLGAWGNTPDRIGGQGRAPRRGVHGRHRLVLQLGRGYTCRVATGSLEEGG